MEVVAVEVAAAVRSAATTATSSPPAPPPRPPRCTRITRDSSGRSTVLIARETLSGTNRVTGASMALPVDVRTIANSSADVLGISMPQILDLERLEVFDRLGAGRMVEIMPHPVAERAAVDERSLQSKMQAHLSCEVDNALADLRLLRFLEAGEGLTRHHAELADT